MLHIDIPLSYYYVFITFHLITGIMDGVNGRVRVKWDVEIPMIVTLLIRVNIKILFTFMKTIRIRVPQLLAVLSFRTISGRPIMIMNSCIPICVPIAYFI